MTVGGFPSRSVSNAENVSVSWRYYMLSLCVTLFLWLPACNYHDSNWYIHKCLQPCHMYASNRTYMHIQVPFNTPFNNIQEIARCTVILRVIKLLLAGNPYLQKTLVNNLFRPTMGIPGSIGQDLFIEVGSQHTKVCLKTSRCGIDMRCYSWYPQLLLILLLWLPGCVWWYVWTELHQKQV